MMSPEDTRIRHVSLFTPLPERSVPIEKDFVPLDQSIVWQFNDAFWRNVDLWDRTFKEHYETALPEGTSVSHTSAFVATSAHRFFHLLIRLEAKKNLPREIIILEQGPGTGEFALQFLNHLKHFSRGKHKFYQRVTYVLSDTSLEALENARRLLRKHAAHVSLHLQKGTHDLPKEYKGNILFARHSNMLDQLPCRLVSIDSKGIGEIRVRAVLDANIEEHLRKNPDEPTLQELARRIREGKVEDCIVTFPKLWKPLMQSLKLEMQSTVLKGVDRKRFPYMASLEEVLASRTDVVEVLMNNGALDNVSALLPLMDFERGAYIEIVDVFLSPHSPLQKPHRPYIFDGSLAVRLNSPLIEAFIRKEGKKAFFEPLGGVNWRMTVRAHDLKTLLESHEFIWCTEIAAKEDEKPAALLKKAQELLSLGIDVLAFSDQAHAWPEFVPMNKLTNMKIFQKLPGKAILPVFAARRKKGREEIERITRDLKKQGIPNLFVVTGDPPPENLSEKPKTTSLHLLPRLSKKFCCGAVALPDARDVPRALKKVKAGAQFLIIQSTYDERRWRAWVKAARKAKLHEKTRLIPSLIPIVTKKSIEAIATLPDVPISTGLRQKFLKLTGDVQVREEGLKLAKAMIADYKGEGIFAGVYIFTRSLKVVRELLAER